MKCVKYVSIMNSYILTLWKKKHISHLGMMPGNQLITLETKTFCLSCVNHTNQFGQRKSLVISEFQWINEEGKVELKITLLQVLVIALGDRHQDRPTSQKTDKRTLGASWWKDTWHQWVLSKNPFWIRASLKVWLLVRKFRAQSRMRNITDLAQSLLWGEPKPRPWKQMRVLTSLPPGCCCLRRSPYRWPHRSLS